jgi:hypothetical protein
MGWNTIKLHIYENFDNVISLVVPKQTTLHSKSPKGGNTNAHASMSHNHPDECSMWYFYTICLDRTLSSCCSLLSQHGQLCYPYPPGNQYWTGKWQIGVNIVSFRGAQWLLNQCLSEVILRSADDPCRLEYYPCRLHIWGLAQLVIEGSWQQRCKVIYHPPNEVRTEHTVKWPK